MLTVVLISLAILLGSTLTLVYVVAVGAKAKLRKIRKAEEHKSRGDLT